MKVNVIRSRMALLEKSQGEIAKLMGISKNTMSSRMKGRSSFTLEEVEKLCEILKIDDSEEKMDIFLKQSSQK